MNPMLCLFMFITLITCGNVLAKEEVIATITNDQSSEVYKFVAETDEENQTIKSLYKDDYTNGKKGERKELPSDELVTDSGVTLEKRGEREVINLKSDNFNNESGGTVTIDTLFNGISGERKEYELELAKSESGWKLFKGKKTISLLHIVTNKKMIVGIIGVKDIVMK